MTNHGALGRPQRLARLLRLCAWIVLAGLAGAAAAQHSIPPAEYRSAPARKIQPAPELLLPRGAPVRRIELPQPTAAEAAPKRSVPAKSTMLPPRNKGGPLQIGFARIVPSAEGAMRLSELSWQTTAGGVQAAQISVTSPGAAAVRLGVTLRYAPPALTARFRGSASGAPVYGPFTAQAIERDSIYWSPALEGDTGTIELELPAGVAPGDAEIALPMISHLNTGGRSLRAFDPYIGSAGSCEVDIACLAPALQQQLATATNAVARMMVTSGGNTYLCTGTLLNDSITSFTPYFLTADHCLEDPSDPAAGKGTAAAAASTINTYWFFQAATCASVETPDFALLVGGAKLLARSVDYDWALVRLNLAPPAGTTFSAWSAEGPIASGTPADAIHHPMADLKKFSQGSVLAYQTFSDGSSFIEMRWTSGVTEPGSSGSGLFTRNATANYYEIRGTLTGGDSSCTNQQGTDYYGRLDKAYPLVAQYLAPNAANATKTAPVIEYYNAVSDAYFMTVDPYEIAGYDNGSPPGWVRTGYRFLAYSDPAYAPADAKPVCRLYAPPPYGDGRFYSASQQECTAMLADPALHFISEKTAAFYLQLPNAAGTCPAGTYGVFRFLDDSGLPRRRYTAEVDLRDSLVMDGGWTLEGTGSASNRVAMCAPASGPALPSTPTMRLASAQYRRIDLNGDGDSDLLWKHADGSSYAWLMNGTTQTSGAPLLGAGTGWSVVQVGDFNGDGRTDLIWQHTDGSTYMWLMNGTAQMSGALLLGPGSGWSVKQVGDFNGDGKDDLVWQHTDGSTYIWLMDGTNRIASAPLLSAGSGWSVTHVGDFNGDGKDDLVWQHTDGSTYVWLMNGTSQLAGAPLLPAGSGWSVVQVGDFNGDGKDDLLWQHTDGSTYIWLMNGTTLLASAPLLSAGSGWSVTHVGDFNGDGKDDLVWQHTDGSTYVGLMNGTSQLAGAPLLPAGSGWSVTHVGDFNGDGKADLVWQHTDGSTYVWLMNETSQLAGAPLLGPATGWSPGP